jgi:hypothetical protein
MTTVMTVVVWASFAGIVWVIVGMFRDGDR